MYIQEKGANRNICQQVCCITFGETSSGPVFGNEIEKKRFLDMLLNAIQDLKINVYAYCVLDYEAYILATAVTVTSSGFSTSDLAITSTNSFILPPLIFQYRRF